MRRRTFFVAPWMLVGPAGIAAGQAHTTPQLLAGHGSDAADGVFPRVVRHVYGTTTIAAKPIRVAAIATGQLDAMLTLGLAPQGVARVEDGGLVSPYLERSFAALLPPAGRLLDLGTRMTQDLEAIAQMRPDLILMNAATPKQELYARLSQIAPTVVTRGTGVNWKIDFQLLAAAVGRSAQAERILATFHADADAFARHWAGRAPSVSFVLSIGGRTRIMGVPSFAGGIAEDLGLTRPAGQRFNQTSRDISLELLDQADADWIFYAGRGGGAATLERAPLWPTLDAVRAKRAIMVDLDSFYLNAGPTAARLVLNTIVARIGR